MKLNLDKLKSNQIPIGKNGLVTDNTRVPVKEKIQPIPLTQEQQQNFKLYGSLNKPEVKQTYLNQGRKLTPAEQQASNKKLAEQGKLQAYQKQQEQDAKNLEKAVEVAPYVIPGIGQAMWAGKAVDLATSGASDGKYKSWGNMVSQKTGSGEFVGDLTNPGYYAGVVGKLATPLVKKGIKSTSRFIDYKLMPERPLTEAEVRLKNIKLNRDGILPEQKTWNMPYKKIVREGVTPFGYDQVDKINGIKSLVKDFQNPKYIHPSNMESSYKKLLSELNFTKERYPFQQYVETTLSNIDRTEPSMRELTRSKFRNRFLNKDMQVKNRHSTWDMYLGYPQKENPLYKVSPLSTTKKTVYTIKPEFTDNNELVSHLDDVHSRFLSGFDKTIFGYEDVFGTMGGHNVISKRLPNGNIESLMSDVWDLQPFKGVNRWNPNLNKLSKNKFIGPLLKPIRNIEVGKALGIGKPLDVRVGFEYNPQTKQIVRHFKQGGVIKAQEGTTLKSNLPITTNPGELTGYNMFRSTLPSNQANNGKFNLFQGWKNYNKPSDFKTALKSNGNTPFITRESDGYHAKSVGYNKESGNYDFLKDKNHQSLQYELNWYNSKDGESFRNQYDLDTSGDYYKYVPKKSFLEIDKSKQSFLNGGKLNKTK